MERKSGKEKKGLEGLRRREGVKKTLKNVTLATATVAAAALTMLMLWKLSKDKKKEEQEKGEWSLEDGRWVWYQQGFKFKWTEQYGLASRFQPLETAAERQGGLLALYSSDSEEEEEEEEEK